MKNIAIRSDVVLIILLGVNCGFDTPTTCEACWYVSLVPITILAGVLTMLLTGWFCEWIFTGEVGDWKE